MQSRMNLEGQLREAKAERKESERERRAVQTVASLKRHIPGGACL